MLTGRGCVGLVDADGGFIPDAEPPGGGEVEALPVAIKDGQDPALRIDFVSCRVSGVRREDIVGIRHLKVSHEWSVAWSGHHRWSPEGQGPQGRVARRAHPALTGDESLVHPGLVLLCRVLIRGRDTERTAGTDDDPFAVRRCRHHGWV